MRTKPTARSAWRTTGSMLGRRTARSRGSRHRASLSRRGRAGFPGGSHATADRSLARAPSPALALRRPAQRSCRLPGVADGLDTAGLVGQLPLLREAHEGLTRHLIPHMETVEAAVFPTLDRLTAPSGTTVPLVEEHREIRRLVVRLGSFIEDVPAHVDRSSVLTLRRILLRLHALLKAHLAEEELYIPILEDRLRRSRRPRWREPSTTRPSSRCRRIERYRSPPCPASVGSSACSARAGQWSCSTRFLIRPAAHFERCLVGIDEVRDDRPQAGRRRSARRRRGPCPARRDMRSPRLGRSSHRGGRAPQGRRVIRGHRRAALLPGAGPTSGGPRAG